MERWVRDFKIMYCYYFRQSQLPYLPRTVVIEPTNHCNLRCLICPQSVTSLKELPRGYMDFTLYKDILEQVKGFAREAVLSFSGESLLHSEILPMIKLAKDSGLEAAFTTNATLLSGHIATEIIKLGLDRLNISFEENPEEYRKIRTGSCYHKTEQNIIRFLRIKKELKSNRPKVVIRSVRRYCYYREDLVASEKIVSKFRENFNGLPVDRFEIVWAMDWASDFRGKKLIETGQVPETDLIIPCRRLWHSMVIRWDGKVVPCCRDIKGDYIIGNVKDTPLKEIWNNQRIAELRKIHLTREINQCLLCKNCDAVRYKKGIETSKKFYLLRYILNRMLWNSFFCF